MGGFLGTLNVWFSLDFSAHEIVCIPRYTRVPCVIPLALLASQRPDLLGELHSSRYYSCVCTSQLLMHTRTRLKSTERITRGPRPSYPDSNGAFSCEICGVSLSLSSPGSELKADFSLVLYAWSCHWPRFYMLPGLPAGELHPGIQEKAQPQKASYMLWIIAPAVYIWAILMTYVTMT
jgi:hypothetical protein